jgi:hypothetical protein
MTNQVRIKVEPKPHRDLRKLARALLLLVEQQNKGNHVPVPPKRKQP